MTATPASTRIVERRIVESRTVEVRIGAHATPWSPAGPTRPSNEEEATAAAATRQTAIAIAPGSASAAIVESAVAEWGAAAVSNAPRSAPSRLAWNLRARGWTPRAWTPRGWSPPEWARRAGIAEVVTAEAATVGERPSGSTRPSYASGRPAPTRIRAFTTAGRTAVVLPIVAAAATPSVGSRNRQPEAAANPSGGAANPSVGVAWSPADPTVLRAWTAARADSVAALRGWNLAAPSGDLLEASPAVDPGWVALAAGSVAAGSAVAEGAAVRWAVAQWVVAQWVAARPAAVVVRWAADAQVAAARASFCPLLCETARVPLAREIDFLQFPFVRLFFPRLLRGAAFPRSRRFFLNLFLYPFSCPHFPVGAEAVGV
jgi:hypothetical protein